MNDKVFFDTNILVYANDSSDRKKQDRARSLIEKSLTVQSAVISVQVLSEFWVTSTQKIEKPLPHHTAEKEIEFFELMDIVELDLPIFREALKFQKLYKFSFWDSLILSAAYSKGCSIIYSENFQHEQKIMDMQIVNPFILKADK